MKKTDLNINEILSKLKLGDENAFQALFSMYEERLYNFVYTFTKSKYATEEIIQEVFIKIWMQKESIDLSKSFTSFIYTVTRNHTYNYLRSVANRLSLKEELWKNITKKSERIENDIIYNEYENIVDEILEGLPRRKKSIFLLSRREGKSNQEIANILEISPKTVKNHLYVTLKIIKGQLEPHLIDTLTVFLFCFLI